MKEQYERKKKIVELVREMFDGLNNLKEQKFTYKELYKIFCAEIGRDDFEFTTFRQYFMDIRLEKKRGKS